MYLYNVNEVDQRKIKSDIRSERKHRYKSKSNKLCNNISESQIQMKYISQEKGVSNLLKFYAISEHGFDHN